MGTINRRSFIKSTGIFTAAMLSKGLFAEGGANSKINVGVIGLGKQSYAHIPQLASDSRCMLTAISDVDDARLNYVKQDVEKRYAQQGKKVEVKTYKDFRRLLADPSIDAVFIVTPDHWHAIMSILAARAGKHIYCEKPMTFSVLEGEQVAKAVKSAGVVFQTGSQQRSEPAFRNAVWLARSGMLGNVREVYCNVRWRFPTIYNWDAEVLPQSIDWDMWIGPAPMRSFTHHLLDLIRPAPEYAYAYPWGEWRWHSDYGNGTQADWGAHHFDIAQWGLGMDGKGPKHIYVYPKQNPSFPNDKKCIYYEYANGAKVFYGSPSILQKKGFNKPSAMVTFIGDEGIACASRGGIFWADKPSLRSVKVRPGGDVPMSNTNHIGNFIEAILTGSPVICPVEIGESSCNMCLIGNIAHKLGRHLEWDWRKKRFVGDPKANALLWREHRGEWKNII